MYQRGLVTLSAGVAIPAYDFGKLQGINLSSYVKIGTNITAEAVYFYSWHIGFGVLLNYSINPINNEKLSEGYLLASSAFTSVTAETEPFRDFSGLAGFVFDIPANEYFSLTFKMMAGLRNVYKPTALIKTTTVFSSVDYYETSNNELLFAFLTSIGVRFKVNENLNAHFTAYYIGSKLEFNYNRSHKEINELSHIGVLQSTLGVSYSF